MIFYRLESGNSYFFKFRSKYCFFALCRDSTITIEFETIKCIAKSQIMQIMRYKVLRELKLRRKKEREAQRSLPAVRSQFFGNCRGTSSETLMWDLDIESRRSNEEWKLDRIIDLDEWPKFDQRGPYWTTRGRTGSSVGKIFKNTRGSCRPRPPPLPLFSLGSLFIYLLLFRGPRIFFLPLGRPSAATEGAAKMQDLWGGVRPEKRKKDAHTVRRQARDDPRWNGGYTREEGRRTENREEIEGTHHPGVMA